MEKVTYNWVRERSEDAKSRLQDVGDSNPTWTRNREYRSAAQHDDDGGGAICQPSVLVIAAKKLVAYQTDKAEDKKCRGEYPDLRDVSLRTDVAGFLERH